VLDAVEDRRLDIEAAALGPGPLPAENQLCPLLAAESDVGEHLVELVLVDDGAHPGLGVERVAELHRAPDLDNLLEQLVLDRALDQQARAGVADFALIEEDAPGCGGGGGV